MDRVKFLSMFRSDIEQRLKRGKAVRMRPRDASESAEDRESTTPIIVPNGELAAVVYRADDFIFDGGFVVGAKLGAD